MPFPDPAVSSAPKRTLARQFASDRLVVQRRGLMDKSFAGGGLILGILAGVIFDNIALGIIFGLMLGAGAGVAKSRLGGRDT